MDRIEELNQLLQEDRHVLQWYAPDLADKPTETWRVEDLDRWHAVMEAEHERVTRRYNAHQKLRDLAEKRSFHHGQLLGDVVGEELKVFEREFLGIPNFMNVDQKDLDRWPPLAMARHLDDLAEGLRDSVPQLTAMKGEGLAELASHNLAKRLFISFQGALHQVEREVLADQVIETAYVRFGKIVAAEGYTVEDKWLRHLAGRMFTGYMVLPW